MEVISSDEKFNVEEFEYFASFQDCAVVGIIGPQSIGKSTLLNHLFNTNFKEWDESTEMGAQTTKGIWVAKANKEPVNVLVMDLEGTDSKERAENDKNFENKIALFALLFADVLLINIGFKDIGKDCAANRPLLKTILQIGLAMESFNTSSKKTLFFVIRDTVPFDEIEINDAIDEQKKNIVQIWGEVHKPVDHENTSLDHFFNVKVFPLPQYPTNQSLFQVEVDKLRLEIKTSIEEGFADSGFYKNAKSVWETIKKNPDLNIPSINALVAFLKCDEIARMKLRDFEADQGWLSVRQDVETTFVSDFGARIKSILSTHLSDYDSKTTNTEGRIRTGQTSSVLTNSCMAEFDRLVVAAKPDQEQPRWDALNVRKQLIDDIELHISKKLPSIVDKCKKQLSKNLKQDLNRLFDAEEEITWTSIRGCLNNRVNEAMNELKIDAAVLKPARDENIRNDMGLCARKVVKKKFRAQHDQIQSLLMIRYIKINSTTFESHRRLNENVSDEECSNLASNEAYRGCVKFLSTVAVLRFDENTYNDVEATLISALLDNGVQISDSYTWEQVPAEDTLITPRDCNETWVRFKQELESANLDLIIPGSLSSNPFRPIANFLGNGFTQLFRKLGELLINNTFAALRRTYGEIMIHLRMGLIDFINHLANMFARRVSTAPVLVSA